MLTQNKIRCVHTKKGTRFVHWLIWLMKILTGQLWMNCRYSNENFHRTQALWERIYFYSNSSADSLKNDFFFTKESCESLSWSESNRLRQCSWICSMQNCKWFLFILQNYENFSLESVTSLDQYQIPDRGYWQSMGNADKAHMLHKNIKSILYASQQCPIIL